jgi:fucose permease
MIRLLGIRRASIIIEIPEPLNRVDPCGGYCGECAHTAAPLAVPPLCPHLRIFDRVHDQRPGNFASPAPTTFWLGIGFLLAGLGTALLGPILPFVAEHWHLTDAASGSLFLPKFIGAFLGGIAVTRRLRLSLLLGTLCAAAGVALFAVASYSTLGNPALLLFGFGLGQIIASSNILAGIRYPGHTGAALALLNFFFSLGAVTTGILAASLVPRFGLRTPLFCFAALLILCGLGGFFTSRSIAPTAPTLTNLSSRPESASVADAVERPAILPPRPLPLNAFLLFATLLFLYGGLETCLASWITTFAIRYTGDAELLHGQSAVVLLWVALTIGRLPASALLRYIPERTVQAVSMILSSVAIIGVAFSHTPGALSLECLALGLALAPFFPATFGLLLHRQPPARIAGFILAVSGLGAALFPWLMGVISTHTGSLRTAMALPAILAVVMLLVTRLPSANPQATA